jgi:hypothetical protein
MDDVIRQATGVWADDRRLMAAWLEGSRAVGTLEWGDYDFHVAVGSSSWPAICEQRLTILGALGPVATFVEASGETAWVMSAVLEDGTWVDLTLEDWRRVGERTRLDQPAMLFDHASVEAVLRPADIVEVEALFRAHLQPLIARFFWAAASCARFARRGDGLSLSQATHNLLFDFAVPALLLAAGQQLPRPHGFNQRYLTADARDRVALHAHRLWAASRDMRAVGAACMGVVTLTTEALGQACLRWGTDWPAQTADWLHSFLAAALD